MDLYLKIGKTQETQKNSDENEIMHRKMPTPVQCKKEIAQVPQVVDLIGFVCTPISGLLIIKALSVSTHVNSIRLKLNLTTDVITVFKRECNLTTAVISRLSVSSQID